MDTIATNLTENFTTTTTMNPYETFDTDHQPMEYLKALTAFVSLCSDVLIIYLIIRYSVLRTRPNIYLANWCICNIVVMLLVPASLNWFGVVDEVSYECMCVSEETIYGVMFGNLLFVVILFLDWYVVSYTKATCSAKYKQMHLFVIALVWTVIVSIFVASVIFCMLNWSYPLAMVCFTFGYLIIFVVMLFVFVLRCVKIYVYKKPVEKSKIELIIVTSYFVCWLLNWVTLYGQIFLSVFFPATFEHVALFVGYSHSWIMLILLYFCDKPMRMCLRKAFGVNESVTDGTIVHKEQSTGLL